MSLGFDIDHPLDDPFFHGDGSTGEADESYPVAINGRGFILDLAIDYPHDHAHRTSISLVNAQDPQQQIGDIAEIAPEVWRRSIDSWHQGGNQDRYDRQDSLPYRFHQSSGIDPWKRYGLSLLHDTSVLLTLSGGQTAILESIQAQLFIAQGTTVKYYATVLTAPVNHTSPATVLALTSDGENLYTLCSNGVVEKRTAAGVWSTFYTVASLDTARFLLAYVKGFLVVGNGPTLLNITTPASVQTIFVHPLAGWWWRAASDGLAVVYVLGGIGDKWHVHRVSISSDAARLDPPIVAASLPEGEIGYALGTYLGYVLIGVHSGWRFGMPDASGQVTYGQIINTPGPVRCFEGQDRFVWFGLSVEAGQVTTGIYADHAGLGRADLSMFVQPMTPAACGDIDSPSTGVTSDVCTVGGVYDGFGKRVFSVDGVGVYVEQDVLVSQGWVSFGGMAFGSTDQKMGMYAQVFTEPLPGGRVGVQMMNDIDTNGFTEVGFNDRAGATGTGNSPYRKPFYSAEMKVVLDRSAVDNTLGPRVSRVEFRAMDIPGKATEFHIPLMLAEDTVNSGTVKARSVADDYDYLMNLVTSRAAFTYREGAKTWELHAVDFTWAPNKLTSDYSTFQGTYMLIARELS